MIKKQTIFVCDNCGRETKEEDAIGWIEVVKRGEWYVDWVSKRERPSLFGLFCGEECHRDNTANFATRLEEYEEKLKNMRVVVAEPDTDSVIWVGNG